MKRIMLVVSYDGTAYSGWQVQPNAVTVEGVLNQTLSELLQEEIQVIGASRTDAGVHALGNVAVFDTQSRIPGEKFSFALNARLPEDIIVQESAQVDPSFHPRKQDCEKIYEYRIYRDRFPHPQLYRYTHLLYGKLDTARMRAACPYLLGEHDFTSFCSAGAQVQSKVRTVYDLQVEEAGKLLTIRVRGNGFLYNMVRIIAGTLIQVGTGRLEPEAIPAILEGRNRELAGPTAPAKGLTLVGIRYRGMADL